MKDNDEMTKDQAFERIAKMLREPLTEEEVKRRCTMPDGTFNMQAYQIIVKFFNYKPKQ